MLQDWLQDRHTQGQPGQEEGGEVGGNRGVPCPSAGRECQ